MASKSFGLWPKCVTLLKRDIQTPGDGLCACLYALSLLFSILFMLNLTCCVNDISARQNHFIASSITTKESKTMHLIIESMHLVTKWAACLRLSMSLPFGRLVLYMQHMVLRVKPVSATDLSGWLGQLLGRSLHAQRHLKCQDITNHRGTSLQGWTTTNKHTVKIQEPQGCTHYVWLK